MKRKYFMKAILLGLTLSMLCGCTGRSDAVFVSATDETVETVELESGGDSVETAQPLETEPDSRETAANSKEADAAQTKNEEIRNEEPKAESNPGTPGYCYVHVCGAVKNPGVYRLQGDARVYEAIAMAGGITEEAYADGVNQALLVYDGQRLQIPTIREWQEGWQPLETEGVSDSTAAAGTASGEAAENGLVNINTATAAELCNLPGIGSTRADAIVAYRQNHGAFQSIEDIKNVTGIKEGLFAKIKEKISI